MATWKQRNIARPGWAEGQNEELGLKKGEYFAAMSRPSAGEGYSKAITNAPSLAQSGAEGVQFSRIADVPDAGNIPRPLMQPGDFKGFSLPPPVSPDIDFQRRHGLKPSQTSAIERAGAKDDAQIAAYEAAQAAGIARTAREKREDDVREQEIAGKARVAGVAPGIQAEASVDVAKLDNASKEAIQKEKDSASDTRLQKAGKYPGTPEYYVDKQQELDDELKQADSANDQVTARIVLEHKMALQKKQYEEEINRAAGISDKYTGKVTGQKKIPSLPEVTTTGGPVITEAQFEEAQSQLDKVKSDPAFKSRYTPTELITLEEHVKLFRKQIADQIRQGK